MQEGTSSNVDESSTYYLTAGIMASNHGKAWTYISTQGGLVKNLTFTDHQVPDEKPDHILIEVLNASLNPGDTKFPNLPVISRLIKYPASPCFDFCGRIRVLPRNLAKDDRNLHEGQIVFGMHRDLKTIGVLKTLLWVHKDAVYPLPENVPTKHGSALGVAAMTAYQAIGPHAKPGNKILITGGAGGVGTMSIQVAKALGMYVIATCSEAGAQLCKDLGADELLDYKSSSFLEDLAKLKVDLVVDCVGNDSQLHRRSEAFLKPDGWFVLVALMTEDWTGIRSMLVSYLYPTWLRGPPRKWRAVFFQAKLSDYEPIARLAGEGKLKVIEDSIFPFEDAPKAFERLLTGRVKGKVIVNVTA